MNHIKKIFVLIMILAFSTLTLGEVFSPVENPDEPQIPILPNEYIESDSFWRMEKQSTFFMNIGAEVVVPLEVMTDVYIYADVVDNQKLTVPFRVAMNKEPERQNMYSLKYSETEMDIDGDGKIDTRIISPTYINSKVVEDNYLEIEGENISKEGIHKKRVYITVEIK